MGSWGRLGRGGPGVSSAATLQLSWKISSLLQGESGALVGLQGALCLCMPAQMATDASAQASRMQEHIIA